MMYLGTSLGGCLTSLMAGEVPYEEVVCIITRTAAPDFNRYIELVKRYHSRTSDKTISRFYGLNGYPLDKVIDMAERLWYDGKIHQPRNYIYDGFDRTIFAPIIGWDVGLWLYISPLNRNAHPAVVDAWEKYKMLDNLTNDE